VATYFSSSSLQTTYTWNKAAGHMKVGLSRDNLNRNDSEVDSSYALHNFTRDTKFRDVNGNKVYTFHNVCVDTTANKDGGSSGKFYRIVAYNNLNGSNTMYKKRLAVHGLENENWWDVYFSSDPIPRNHKVLHTAAFFISPYFMNNIYHFWEDFYIRLLSVLKSTNHLHKGMENRIIYRTEQSKYGRDSFKDLLPSLYPTKYNDVYYKLPTNTCFRSVVFGAENTLHRKRDAVDHALSELKIRQQNNSEISDCMVLIQRKYRRIININDLQKAAIAVGFKRTKVVLFEVMSVKEQMTVAANCRLMLGVHGAGLQWAIFMPPDSTLIEISWKRWTPFYGFVKTYNINYINLNASDVQVNWRAFELHRRKGKKCSEQEKLQLLNPRIHNAAANVWREADVTVDRDEFTQLIRRVRENNKRTN